MDRLYILQLYSLSMLVLIDFCISQRGICFTMTGLCLYVKAQLALEARVREEVTKEFSELISQMQEDYRSEMACARTT